MTRQIEHRKGRREKGLCATEGCAASSGDHYRCDMHAEAHRIECRRLYKRKRRRIKQMRKLQKQQAVQ